MFDQTTHARGRCRKCEKADGLRHVYQWKRSRKRLLRDAICPSCKGSLHGTSNELRGRIVYHDTPPNWR